MANRRRQNWQGQQRVDAPHLKSVESAISNDFDELLSGLVIGESQSYIVRGFTINMPGSIGSSANGLQLVVSNSSFLHGASNESGTFFTIPTGTSAEILSSTTNTKVEGAFTPNTDNYIGIEFVRAVDDATADQVYFWNPTTNVEITKTTPLAIILDYKIVIATSSFASNVLPITVVQTDASNNVISITDRRPLLCRLGTAGNSAPNPSFQYAWSDGRSENFYTSTSSTSDPFLGGDKQISSIKELFDALMTEFKLLKGTAYWYEENIGGSIINLRADIANTVFTGRGIVEHTEDTPGQVKWSSDIYLRFVGGRHHYKIESNATSFVQLQNNEVAYVNITRDQDVLPKLVWVNGGTTVNSVGAVSWTGDLEAGDFIKKTSDSITKYYQIDSITNVSEVELTEVYNESSTGASGTESQYSYGNYRVNAAPSTNRHVQIASRESVPFGEDQFWLFYRDDNGDATQEIQQVTANADAPAAVGVKEITDYVFVDQASANYNGTYVLFRTIASEPQQQYIWFNLDSGSVDPAPVASIYGWELNVTTGDSANDIATEAYQQAFQVLQSLTEGIATDPLASNTVTWEDASVGAIADPVESGIGVGITTVTQQGADAGNPLDGKYFLLFDTYSSSQYALHIVVDGSDTVPDVQGYTLVPVPIASGATADDVANAIATAATALTDITSSFIAAGLSNISNDKIGYTPDIVDGEGANGTGFTFGHTQQGTGAVVYARFLGSELEQGERRQISDNDSNDHYTYTGSTGEFDSKPDYTNASGANQKNVWLVDGESQTKGIKRNELKEDAALRATSNGNKTVTVSPSYVTAANGNEYRITNGPLLSDFGGTVLNMEDGTFVGGTVVAFAQVDFTGEADKFFKYTLNLLQNNEILVIPSDDTNPASFGTTVANTPNPPILEDAVAFAVVTVQNDSAISVTAIRSIKEANLIRIPLGGSGGSGGGSSLLERMEDLLDESFFEYLEANTFSVDGETKVGSTDASYSVIDKGYEFNVGEFIQSYEMLDLEFLEGSNDLLSVMATLIFKTGAVDPAPVVELSNNGVDFQAVTMERLSDYNDTYNGNLTFDLSTLVIQTLQDYDNGNTDSTVILEDVGTIQVSQEFTSSQAEIAEELSVEITKTGTPTGYVKINFHEDNAGDPGDVKSQSLIDISTLATGVQTVEIGRHPLLSGVKYHISVETDAGYKASYSTGVDEIGVDADSSAPTIADSKTFNGTVWAANAGVSLIHKVEGRALSLLMKYTASADATLLAYGAYYGEASANVQRVKRRNVFVFDAISNLQNEFQLTFDADPDFLEVTDRVTGEFWGTPSFELQNNKVVFPVDFFEGREIVHLVAKQNDAGSFDGNPELKKLLTENHLASGDPSITKGVAGRGPQVLTETTAIRVELTLDEDYNLVIKEA